MALLTNATSLRLHYMSDFGNAWVIDMGGYTRVVPDDAGKPLTIKRPFKDVVAALDNVDSPVRIFILAHLYQVWLDSTAPVGTPPKAKPRTIGNRALTEFALMQDMNRTMGANIFGPDMIFDDGDA